MANPSSVTSEIARPRLVMEMQDDGTIVAEIYLNGQRQRVALTRGMEGMQARELLSRVVNDRQRQAERALAKREAEELSRHRRVWTHCAEAPGQGVGFANRVIGPKNSLTRTANKSTVTSSVDLL